MDQQYGPGTGGFGLVSAGLIGSLVLLAWAAIWAARRVPPLRRLGERLSNSAVIGKTLTWVSDRIGDRGRSLARRWAASEVAGVALLLGLAVVVALAVGFTEVLDDVLEGDGIAGIDQPVTRWLAAHRDLWLTTTLRAVTLAGGPLFLAALAFPISVAAGCRCRSWRPVVLALVGGGGVSLMLFAAKALVGRKRPPLPFALIDADGYSFPSGHATGTVAIMVVAAWMLTRWLIPWWTGRVMVWTIAIGSAFLIGFSRVYLGVHYVSDVLAGWMLGMAWAGTVMLVGTWWDNTRRAPRSSGSALP
ncbi:phosphatase PAP2 family protein [Mycobacterium nebraskense]|uniref:Phosphatidic acid phosphatase n=1 Tax=Mycobacterium nebraskense TaxID=244292 RepID=A0A0F5NCJ8_9MYCO|nr:phosphatase PAP2 family protein [Mycobacterium nebraskense]KKC04746.1 phosphatidic acid phosphatase [Mycobacterium nebraskense]KLO41431.1 phosphatidic acid phosphatase [Mycobacterium nebraskense]MBI2697482.1 phosphatase PAP2 family protein [Mycobacterium nebraskense]MCV7118961.1 phosphatase PAP2 family protein [Mycobacterium nebraskense]ORW18134.1 phosphatidic acid phosphatase [Mycobacterium nebraskense]